MQWIWSFEQLAKVCRYKSTDPERLSWSIERLGTLYPEQAADVLIEVIGKGDINAAEEVLSFFETHQDTRYSQALRDLYTKYSGQIAGYIAGVLGKWKDEEVFKIFKEKYAGSFGENIKKDSDGYIFSLVLLSKLRTDEIKKEVEGLFKNLSGPDIEFAAPVFTACVNAGAAIGDLLEIALDNPEFHSSFNNFLEAIGEYCLVDLDGTGITHLDNVIPGDEMDEENPVIGKFLNVMETIYRGDLWHNKTSPFNLLKKQKYKETVTSLHQALDRLIEDRKKVSGAENYARWESTANGGAKNNLDAIRAIAHISPRLTDGVKSHFAYGVILLFFNLLTYRQVIGITLEEIPISERWSLFLEDRRNVPADHDSFDYFKSAEDIDQKVEECFNVLENDPNGSACFRIIRFLGSFGKPRYFKRLLCIDFEDQELWDEISRGILSLEPGAALNLVAPVLDKEHKNMEAVLCALNVMADLPMEGTVRLLLQHWEWLYSLDQAYFLTVLSTIADRRFLRPLKGETLEYSQLEWETYDQICRVNGIKDPWIKTFGKKIKKFQREKLNMARLFEDDRLEEFLQKPVYLDLECRQCARIYTYKVHRIHFVPESLDIFIADQIFCKHCAVLDHYRLTPMVSLVMMPLISAYMKVVTDFTDHSQLVIVPITATFQGGKPMSQKGVLDYYQQELSKSPDDPALLVGYANSLRSAKRTADANIYFEKAIRSDPDAVEAYLGLGQNEEHKENFHNAYDYYWEVAEKIHTGNYYHLTEDVEDFKKSFAHHFTHISDATKKPLHPNILDILAAYHMD
ncbi:MAG: tetratricopeptide repeat protein [bacterium]|nr:tetratricopeptide repeat protein [bacterium]